jgi:predicted Zn finger-like uncharacterized protein
MYTQCSHCGAMYPVDARTLAQARGQVRCGHCGSVFNALERLTDAAPINPDARVPTHRPADLPPVLNRAPRLSDADDPDIDEDIEAGRAEVSADAAVLLKLASERARFSERERAALPPRPTGSAYLGAAQKAVEPKPSRLLATLFALLLALLLALQVAYLYRREWLGEPRLAALVNRALNAVGFTLPPLDEPGSVVLMSRSVDKHPSEPRALLVNLNLSNQAPYPVRYPWIELKMSNLNGQPVAMRRFAPVDYLAEPERFREGLAAGAVLAVTLELEDPGQDALAFEFGFR